MSYDARINEIAAIANEAFYDSANTEDYLGVAPHMKHKVLRDLYSELILEVFNAALMYRTPRVLDIGAGEGAASLPFLELGGKVTAIDISRGMLEALQHKCQARGHELEIVCSDVFEALKTMRKERRQFDIIAASSFLHHIPDYLQLMRDTLPLLSEQSLFFSFQDPLRFDSVGKTTKTFSNLTHYTWRVIKGDELGGIKRHFRRKHGADENNQEDYTEYHYFRNGVDQDAIRSLFDEFGYDCRIISYFSTQSDFWLSGGSMMKLTNTFAFVARSKTVGATASNRNVASRSKSSPV